MLQDVASVIGPGVGLARCEQLQRRCENAKTLQSGKYNSLQVSDRVIEDVRRSAARAAARARV